mgnify:CR=1 FL=1
MVDSTLGLGGLIVCSLEEVSYDVLVDTNNQRLSHLVKVVIELLQSRERVIAREAHACQSLQDQVIFARVVVEGPAGRLGARAVSALFCGWLGAFEGSKECIPVRVRGLGIPSVRGGRLGGSVDIVVKGEEIRGSGLTSIRARRSTVFGLGW